MPRLEDGAHNGDEIVVETLLVHEAGQKITKDAQDLQTKIENEWGKYWTQLNKVTAVCLYNDFDSFRTQQTPLTQKAIDNRIKIGQTLQNSATLYEFQEKVNAKRFDGPNIYAENNYYPKDNTNPADLQRPSGFGVYHKNKS
jgi:hypothetical protein